jgi:4a-hydroxytetrahydrobiopterin dehydratase
MAELEKGKCVPCHGGVDPATDEQIRQWMPQVPDWRIEEPGGVKRLVRTYSFPDFVQALAFTNEVGGIAEEEGHHPAILTEWGKATVSWWTHAIGGLHMNDFIMAAKTDGLFKE